MNDSLAVTFDEYNKINMIPFFNRLSKGVLVFLFICSGCTSIGPGVLRQDGQSYNYALKDTEEVQLLLNIVRMQYGDRPYFVSVSSITSSTSRFQSIGGDLFASRTGQTFRIPDPALPSSIIFGSASLSPSMSYTDTPNITYFPLQGTEFTLQMLTPIPLQKINLLIQGGWSLARMLRLTVQEIGNLRNAPGSTRPATSHVPEYKPFIEFAHLLRTLERQHFLRWRGLPIKKDQPYIVEVSLIRKTPYSIRSMSRLVKLLGFTHYHDQFYIQGGDNGMVYEDIKTVTIQARSFLGMLYYLSKSVQVRQEDILKGVVTIPRFKDGHYFRWYKVTSGILRVHLCLEKPKDNVTLAIRYRGLWFYIKDTDSNSKETLSLLEQLFSLLAGNMNGHSPALTLNV